VHAPFSVLGLALMAYIETGHVASSLWRRLPSRSSR
jgi:hypothetical protein